ncbi:MAG: cytochrome c oxidase subunit II [Thermoanaerobaculia bacterium]
MNPDTGFWDDLPLFPEQASTLAREVDALYFFAVTVAIVFSLLVAALVLFFAVRYRRRHPDEVGQPEKTITWLEITWSVIPFVILMVMFGWGAKVFFTAFRPPSDAVEYFVVGKQWMWKFQHPQGRREINDLHVPIGQPIKLTMTSEDVIHSFFVPAFRVKADVLPGRYTTVWFEATKAGAYDIFCAEYCGAEHSRMGGTIHVMEPRDYEAWLSLGAPADERLLSGEELFAKYVCNTCHYPDSAARAPILGGVFGTEEQLSNGSGVRIDENYLRESILNPAARVVAGYQPLMPTYQGQIGEEELIQLIAYIKGLEPRESAP